MGGDILDIPFIYSKDSTYQSNLKRGNWDGYFIPEIEKEAIWFDGFYDLCRKYVLDDSDIIFLEGNHEQRTRREQFISRVPVDLRHNFNLRRVLKANDRRLRVLDYNDWARIRSLKQHDLNITHGQYCGMNPIKKHIADAFLGSVLFGHTHELGAISMKSAEETVIGYNNPCACAMEVPYLEGRISNWTKGFTMINATKDYHYVNQFVVRGGELILPTGETMRP